MILKKSVWAQSRLFYSTCWVISILWCLLDSLSHSCLCFLSGWYRGFSTRKPNVKVREADAARSQKTFPPLHHLWFSFLPSVSAAATLRNVLFMQLADVSDCSLNVKETYVNKWQTFSLYPRLLCLTSSSSSPRLWCLLSLCQDCFFTQTLLKRTFIFEFLCF